MELLITVLALLLASIAALAVVQNPLIGRARKSVGGATFSKWKGLNILKAKAHPHNPQTNEQTTNRVNFKTVSLTMRRALDAADNGFPGLIGVMSGFNAAMKKNIGISFVKNSVAPHFPTVTFSAVTFSGGSIDNVNSPGVTNTTIAGFQVGWTDNSNGTTAKSTDTAIVVILDHVATVVGTKRFYESLVINQLDTRASANVSKSIAGYWSGRLVACYIFMHRDGTPGDPENASDTTWVTDFTFT